MISVFVTQRRSFCKLEISGHAGYCPGNDIVCSACSALTQALVGWVLNNPKHIRRLDRLTGYSELLPGAGRGYISATGDRMLRSAFMTAVIGLCQVAVTYPDNVRVHINGVLVSETKGEK